MALKIVSEDTVFIPKPTGMTYAEAMSRLRMWLDYKKVQPSGFKITAGGQVGFEIRFSSERDAQAFELFDWPDAIGGKPKPISKAACVLPSLADSRR